MYQRVKASLKDRILFLFFGLINMDYFPKSSFEDKEDKDYASRSRCIKSKKDKQVVEEPKEPEHKYPLYFELGDKDVKSNL